jgi:broad specificity phosphatase PhoE
VITHVYLIRHGETVWNKEGRFQGHKDIPLSETGIRQARLLSRYLAKERPAAIYSSDLTRARQTAELIAEKHGLEVRCFPDFRERCGGEWEGRTHLEVRQTYQDFEEVRIRGGKYGVEPTEAVQKRFVGRLHQLMEKHRGDCIFIVAHGMCIAAALTVLTGGEHGYGKSRLDNTSVTRLAHDPDSGWKVLGINETVHLQAEQEGMIR